MFGHFSRSGIKVVTNVNSGVVIDGYPPPAQFFFKFIEPSDYDNPIP